MSSNLAYFREKMVSAPRALKESSRRMHARADLPAAVPRLQVPRIVFVPEDNSWAALLQGRTGWFGVAFAEPPSAGDGHILLL